MFDFLRPRKKLAELFGTDVPSDLTREMLKAGDHVNRLERKSIHFLCVAVNAESEDQIGVTLGALVTVAKEHKWSTAFMCSNFAILVESSAFNKGVTSRPLPDLVQGLSLELGQRCKSLGGERIVAWGEYGAARRVCGPLFPDFLQLVASLEKQPFGSHEGPTDSPKSSAKMDTHHRVDLQT